MPGTVAILGTDDLKSGVDLTALMADRSGSIRLAG